MQVVGKVKTNDEGLECPKCGAVLKPSLMEEDMFVCPDCVERFRGDALRGTPIDLGDEAADSNTSEFADYLSNGADAIGFEDLDEIIDEVNGGDVHDSSKTVTDAKDNGEVSSAIDEDIIDDDKPEEQHGSLVRSNPLDEAAEGETPYAPSAMQEKTAAAGGKTGHPGLMFLLGFILGAIVACGAVIGLNFAGIEVPYLTAGAGAASGQFTDADGDEPVPTDVMADKNEDLDNQAIGPEEDLPIVTTASMRELLKSMGYFDDKTLESKGGNTVDLPVKGVPAIIHVVYSGDGSFEMTAMSKGAKGDVLLDVSGPYDGTVTTYFCSAPVDAVEISADGEWAVSFIPMGNMLHAKNGSIECDNGDVVFFDEENVSKIRFAHDGDGDFKVKAAAVDGAIMSEFDVIDVSGKYDAELDWVYGKAFFYVQSDTPWELSWS